MYTLCPHCQTVARIDAARLNADRGQVACEQCGQDFQAFGHLYDEALDAQAARLALRRAAREQAEAQPEPAAESIMSAVLEPAPAPVATAVPALEPSAEGDRDLFAQPGVHDSAEQPGVVPPVTVSAVPVDEGIDWDSVGQPPLERLSALEPVAGQVTGQRLIEDELLEELERPRGGVSGGALGGLFLATLLVAVLAGQYLYFHRSEFAADPRWRPWLEQFCEHARCHIPMRRDLASIELVDRDVRTHPQVGEALLISATIVNRAGFVQPHPVFEVAFSDLSGNPVALRRFAPREYLPAPPAPGVGMEPDYLVHIQLEVVNPGEHAVSFQLDFL